MPNQGQWVRIKGGLYQEDLAQVAAITTENQIWVKLIPRIDFSAKKGSRAMTFQRTA